MLIEAVVPFVRHEKMKFRHFQFARRQLSCSQCVKGGHGPGSKHQDPCENMGKMRTPSSSFGSQIQDELHVEALFSARIWEGLRLLTVEAIGRERWRQVMMAALNNGDHTDGDPSRIPIQRLIDEVVFALGINRITLFERMGRRLMQDHLLQCAPLFDVQSDALRMLSMVLGFCAELGVVDIRTEHEEGSSSGNYLLVKCIPLFKGSSAFFYGALKELGDHLGLSFQLDLLNSGELTRKGNEYRVYWKRKLY